MASKRKCNRSNINTLLESLFTVSDSDLINISFNDIVESRSTDSDQHDYIQRALHILSVSLEAGKRFSRKCCSNHNESVWPLPSDLTIKVYSMLDTASVFCAEATCLFFQKCAEDPLCYANIDLVTSDVKYDDEVVDTVIERAGKAIQSIKLGVLPLVEQFPHDEQILNLAELKPRSYLLTRFCLSSLSENGGAPGSCLRRLHIYHIEIDNTELSATLSVCPLLIDLEVVKLEVFINSTLESVSEHCPLMERFIYEGKKGRFISNTSLSKSVCEKFVLNCPKITTLALKGDFDMSDSVAFKLVKGFHELKYVNFTNVSRMTGSFLKNLGMKHGGNNKLDVMILHKCTYLKILAVERFMEALLEGKFRLLRHLDISYTKGLECFVDNSILVKQLLEQRPDFCFVAEYYKSRFDDIRQTSDSSEYDTSDSEESNYSSSD